MIYNRIYKIRIFKTIFRFNKGYFIYKITTIFFNEYNNSNTYTNNNNQNQNSQIEKYYKIKETINEFYIKNNKINKSIKISKINRVQNESKDAINIYQADSIIGIFDINDKKYLGIVTESKVSAKLLNNFIFRILKVKLIKMPQ